MFEHRFYFLRHGETEWNKTHKTQGQLNSQLNATGRGQAERAAEALKNEPIARIVASPLDRVRDTAQVVARFHNVDLTFDDALMECHLGDHQGQPHGPWLAQYWEGRHDPPNGETFADFVERVWAAMVRAAALGPNTLIVAHGGLWRAAHERVRIRPVVLPMPNALPLRIEPTAAEWSVTQLL
ncbi:MAG: histidine phosphatase family protein [Ahrensia sp.]|nr:histidine phosphatase family protein [Ahrensia sp.]